MTIGIDISPEKMSTEYANANAFAERWFRAHRPAMEGGKVSSTQLQAEAVMRQLLDYIFYQKDFDIERFSNFQAADPVEQTFRMAIGRDDEEPIWGPRDTTPEIVRKLGIDQIANPGSRISKMIAALEKNIPKDDLGKISGNNFL